MSIDNCINESDTHADRNSIEFHREIILSPRGEDTRKEALHGLSSRLNDFNVEKRVERAKGSGETRHEDGCIEEKRTRKDRLSRSSEEEEREKEGGREGGEEKKRKDKKKKQRKEGGLKIAARGSSHTGSRQDYIAESSLRKDHIAFVHSTRAI